MDQAVPEIDVEQLSRRRGEGTPLIDVREPHEYEEAHVPGAVLIPLGELAERLGEVPNEGEVCVICRSGARSLRAAELLRANGVEAVNVAGGTLAWIESGRATDSGPA
ncbi:MAG: rhodanese-like domain-containing protein [Acidimicrobiales bacterium]